MSNTITPNLGLKKPAYQDGRWDKPVNKNWDILDEIINKCGGATAQITSTQTTDMVEDKQNNLVAVSDDYTVQVFDTSVSPAVVLKSFGSLNHVKSIAMKKKVLVWIDDNGFAGHDLNTDTALTAAGGVLVGANDIDIATLGTNDQCIAIATDNGLSVIVGSSAQSYNLIATSSLYTKVTKVKIVNDELRFLSTRGTIEKYLCVFSIPTATESQTYYNHAFSVYKNRYHSSSVPAMVSSTENSDDITLKSVSKDSGITLIEENSTDYSKGMTCFIDTEFNSGWMMGNLVGSWLCNDVTVDRHKPGAATTLTKHGSLFLIPVVSGSELKAVSGFSTANYLEKDNTNFSDTLYAYCWVKGATGWKFKHGIVSASPIDGVSVTGTVLKVEGAYPKALLRLTKDTPTAVQLTKIEADEQPIFNGEKCLIQGTDKKVKSLFEDSGVVYAGTIDSVTSFDGLTAKTVHNGDTTAIGGNGVFGGTSGATIVVPKEDICLIVENLKKEDSALNAKITLLEEKLKPCNASLTNAISTIPGQWVSDAEVSFINATGEESNGITTDKAACTFTIQKDGMYQINVIGLYYYAAITTAGFIYLETVKNGTDVLSIGPERIMIGAVGNTNAFPIVSNLVSGDVISFRSRAKLTTISNAKVTSVSFSIFKV